MGRHSIPSPQGSYTAVEERAEGRVRAGGRVREIERLISTAGGTTERVHCGAAATELGRNEGQAERERERGRERKKERGRDRPQRLLSEALALARRGVGHDALAHRTGRGGRSTHSLEYTSPDSTPIRHKLGLTCLIPWEARSLTTRSVKGISNFHTQPTRYESARPSMFRARLRVRLAACV